MCPPSTREQLAMPDDTRRALRHSVAIVILVVRTALAGYSRPSIGFTPGAPAGVDPRPLRRPPRHHRSRPGVWRPR